LFSNQLIRLLNHHRSHHRRHHCLYLREAVANGYTEPKVISHDYFNYFLIAAKLLGLAIIFAIGELIRKD
jgi:hypothetical protein